MIKRMMLAVPPFVKAFPHQDHPQSDVVPVLIFEQINPYRQYTVRCSHIAALHKATGYVPDAGKRGGVNPADVLPIKAA